MSGMTGRRIVGWADEWIDAEVGGWVGGCVGALMEEQRGAEGQSKGAVSKVATRWRKAAKS